MIDGADATKPMGSETEPYSELLCVAGIVHGKLYWLNLGDFVGKLC